MEKIPEEDLKFKMREKEEMKSFQMQGVSKKGCIVIAFIIVAIFAIVAWVIYRSQTTPTIQKNKSQEDKSLEIASFIQEKVNVGGYNGCSAKRVGNQLVQVDMKFPAGTDRLTVEANTSGVADHFAQVGRLASTIHYAGYSGSLKVCEYQYDMFRGTVKKID